MPHLEEGTLHALLDEELTSIELQEARAHLQACTECRGRLEEAQRLLFEADDLVAAVEVPAGPSPAFVSRRAPAIKLYPYIAWAATVMLAVGVGYAVGERSESPVPLADAFEAARDAPSTAEAAGDADGAAAGQLDDRAQVAPAEAAKEEQPARKLASSERPQRGDVARPSQAVRGQVRDIGGAPIANAQVVVLGTELQAVTDAQGRYEIKGPLPDTVTLRAASIGRRPVEVKELALESGLTAKQDFTLQPSTPAFEGVAIAAAPSSVPRDEVTSKQRVESEVRENRPVDRIDSASAVQHGMMAKRQPAARGGRASERVTYVDGVPAVPGYGGELSAFRAGQDAAEVPVITDQVSRQGEARRRIAPPQGAAQAVRGQALRQYQDSAARAGDARRIDLDEAARRLSGAVRLLDGKTPNHVALVPAGTVPGAINELEVVRLVYREENGRELLLDQQRVLVPGDSAVARDKVIRSQETDLAPGDTLLVTRPNGVATVRWLDGKGLRLSLSGRVPLDSLRTLLPRVH